jgi:hemerythrin-like metal-binding protein
MSVIEWSAALETGVPDIDTQHRELVGLINKLSLASQRGRDEVAPILAALDRYAAEHFRFEESMLADTGETSHVLHLAEHRAFSTRVAEFRAEFEAGSPGVTPRILHYLTSWFIGHISGSDRRQLKDS